MQPLSLLLLLARSLFPSPDGGRQQLWIFCLHRNQLMFTHSLRKRNKQPPRAQPCRSSESLPSTQALQRRVGVWTGLRSRALSPS